MVRAAAEPARLRVPQGRRQKTRDSFNDKGWSTVGDMGYLDADGYLFLTDRRTFMIVSGGVNIYPQEAENLLIDHPKVYDVAVFGIPDPEMGERVHAVVQPTDWDDAGPELERELLAYCREHLAHYKCPQAVDFDPRAPARTDRQALQAAAARPLLGRQDEPHRLIAMEPADCSRADATATSSSSRPASCCARRATAVSIDARGAHHALRRRARISRCRASTKCARTAPRS